MGEFNIFLPLAMLAAFAFGYVVGYVRCRHMDKKIIDKMRKEVDALTTKGLETLSALGKLHQYMLDAMSMLNMPPEMEKYFDLGSIKCPKCSLTGGWNEQNICSACGYQIEPEKILTMNLKEKH